MYRERRPPGNGLRFLAHGFNPGAARGRARPLPAAVASGSRLVPPPGIHLDLPFPHAPAGVRASTVIHGCGLCAMLPKGRKLKRPQEASDRTPPEGIPGLELSRHETV
jgi:hypothetical protein